MDELFYINTFCSSNFQFVLFISVISIFLSLQTMESNKASKADLESGNGLKTRLEEALKKCVELEILTNPDKHTDDSDSGKYLDHHWADTED